MTVMVSGMVAGVPGQAGASWSVLQWVLGLKELGHRVVLVEEVSPEKLVPAGAPLEESGNARYFHELVSEFGIEGDSSLLAGGTTSTAGLPYEAVLRMARECDCLLNTSGTLKDPRILGAIPKRAYLDVDPAFTQLWDLQGHDLGLEGHDRFVTLGLSIGDAACPVPTGGRKWIPTLPPVVLSRWPAAAQPPERPFTTVVNWRGYGSVEHAGSFYGQKVHSFRRFFALPAATGERFELACAISPEETDDVAALDRYGWRLVDPSHVAGTAGDYRNFVSESAAELNVAKKGYVESRCGWFSDRSACYLASGRPVVAQDTGLPDSVASGDGFLTFGTLDEAAQAVAEVRQSYGHHRRAAREFAEQHLDSRSVIPRVLEEVLR
jgi:glycosyltransferase involved in cell wall biosynthesis